MSEHSRKSRPKRRCEPSKLEVTERNKSLADLLGRGAEWAKNGALGGSLNERLEDVLITEMGDPHSESENELRWGNRGSLSVITGSHRSKGRGTWYSHEDSKGGRSILSLLGWHWNLEGGDLTEKATKLLENLPSAPQHIAMKKPVAKPNRWTAEEAIDKFWDQATSLRIGDKSPRAYLKSRGIHSTKLSHDEVRQVKHGASKTATVHKAIVFPIRNGERNLMGIHAIRLSGDKKQTGQFAKLSNGNTKGGAIMFGRPEPAELVLVEGPEDAMSIYQETGLPVWAAMSVGNLGNVPLPSRCQSVVIIGDADQTREETIKQAMKLGQRCPKVAVAFPEGEYKDANDILMGEGKKAKEVYEELISNADHVGGDGPILYADSIDETFDPANIPQRQWQVGGLTMLGSMTMIVSPGAVGKSTFGILIGVSVALGRDDMIPGHSSVKRGNVLVMNSEDDEYELQRRLAGVLSVYGIEPGELKGKYYLQSLYGQMKPARLAQYERAEDKVSAGVLVGELVEYCIERNIKLIILDPFISFHNVPENANEHMEEVLTILRRLAVDIGAALIAVHHTGKTGGDAEAHAGEADSGRGASAISWAARTIKTLARMSKKTAKKLNVDWSEGVDLRRIDDAKLNYARADEEATWFKMKSTRIANGEDVPVPREYDMSAKAAAAEESKSEEGKKRLEEQCDQVGQALLKRSEEGRLAQSEVVAILEPLLGVGRATANSRLQALGSRPHGFYFEGHKYKVWRENVGTAARPRYFINWGASKPPAKSDLGKED